MYVEYFRVDQRGEERQGTKRRVAKSGEVRFGWCRGERQSNRAEIIRENSLWESAGTIDETRPCSQSEA